MQWTLGYLYALLLGIFYYLIVQVIPFYLLFLGIIVLWSVIIIALRSYERRKFRNDKIVLTSSEKVTIFFQDFLKPIKYLLSMPVQNENFKCPRCESTEHYNSKEQTSSANVGILIDNPNGPDFGGFQPVSYDIDVKRCKSCNSEMNRFVNSRYFEWAARWKEIGYFTFVVILLWVAFSVILPYFVDLLDY
jgi:phage FluMu protein Com